MADRLYRVAEHHADEIAVEWALPPIDAGTFLAWHESGTTIDGLAGFNTAFHILRVGTESVHVMGAAVSRNFFDVLGVRPVVGRTFSAAGPDFDASDVVLGEPLWRSRFAGDPRIVGRAITLDDRPHTVVGVMPAGVWSGELWTVAVTPSAISNNPRSLNLSYEAVVRLKNGVTAAQAEAEATAIARRVNGAADRTAGQRTSGVPRIALTRLRDSVTGSVRRPIIVLIGAVLVVLLIAGMNAASLLLVHSLGRGRELAVRAALGASAGRIARQLFLDSVVIGTVAAILGLAAALGFQHALVALAPDNFPRLRDVRLDWRVLSFGLAAGVAGILLSGTAPAWHGGRLGLVSALRSAPGAAATFWRRVGIKRTSGVLLIGEVALSCALVIVALLLSRSFLRLVSVDPGYRPEGVLTAQVAFPASMAQGDQEALTTQLLERLEANAGVQAAGMTSVLPLEPVKLMFRLSSGPNAPDDVSFDFRLVSPGFLEATGMTLLRGRDFTWNDTASSPPVLVVNEAFERHFLSTGAFRWPHDQAGRPWSVIGVVADVHDDGLGTAAEPTAYMLVQAAPADVLRPDRCGDSHDGKSGRIRARSP